MSILQSLTTLAPTAIIPATTKVSSTISKSGRRDHLTIVATQLATFLGVAAYCASTAQTQNLYLASGAALGTLIGFNYRSVM